MTHSILSQNIQPCLEVGVDAHDAVDGDPRGEDVGNGGHGLQAVKQSEHLFSCHSLIMSQCPVSANTDLVGCVEHRHLRHDEAEAGPGHPGEQQPAPLQLDQSELSI